MGRWQHEARPKRKTQAYLPETETIRDEQITIMEADDCVSGQSGCVSKPHMKKVVQKVAQILATQGVSCCECPRTQYKLYPLSDCKETDLRYSLQIVCPDGKMPYRFELTLSLVIPPEDRSNAPVNQTGTQNEERTLWQTQDQTKIFPQNRRIPCSTTHGSF